MNKIVLAESGWKVDAHNPISSASGLVQFLDSTFKSQCIDKYGITDTLDNKDDPYIQIECMVKIIENGGINHWVASKNSWGKD